MDSVMPSQCKLARSLSHRVRLLIAVENNTESHSKSDITEIVFLGVQLPIYDEENHLVEAQVSNVIMAEYVLR